jgi:hypothetical protein
MARPSLYAESHRRPDDAPTFNRGLVPKIRHADTGEAHESEVVKVDDVQEVLAYLHEQAIA